MQLPLMHLSLPETLSHHLNYSLLPLQLPSPCFRSNSTHSLLLRRCCRFLWRTMMHHSMCGLHSLFSSRRMMEEEISTASCCRHLCPNYMLLRASSLWIAFSVTDLTVSQALVRWLLLRPRLFARVLWSSCRTSSFWVGESAESNGRNIFEKVKEHALLKAHDEDYDLTLFSRKLPRFFSPWSFLLLQNMQQNRTGPASSTKIADSKSRNKSIALPLPDGDKNRKDWQLKSFEFKICNYSIRVIRYLPVYMPSSFGLTWEQLDISFWPDQYK